MEEEPIGCPFCGYDLRAHDPFRQTVTCPECGASVGRHSFPRPHEEATWLDRALFAASFFPAWVVLGILHRIGPLTFPDLGLFWTLVSALTIVLLAWIATFAAAVIRYRNRESFRVCLVVTLAAKVLIMNAIFVGLVGACLLPAYGT